MRAVDAMTDAGPVLCLPRSRLIPDFVFAQLLAHFLVDELLRLSVERSESLLRGHAIEVC